MLPRSKKNPARPVPSAFTLKFRLLLLLALVAGSGHGRAQQDVSPWRLCPAPPERAPLPPSSGDGVTVAADQARVEGERGEQTVFMGDVVVEREGKRLSAEQARYDRTTDVVTAEGGVEMETGNLFLQGARAQLDFGTDSGELEEASYYVPEAHAYGKAERLGFKGGEQSELHEATYTTCPPGKNDWALHARRIQLDRVENTGEAYDVTLRIGGVPTLYLPYMTFPLEGRKSGLLAPSYGTSDRNGTDVAVPWYWNIAPNQDATFTPRVITARGSMLMSEYRYLTEGSSGQITFDYLPDDKMYGDNRSQVTLRNRTRLTPRWNVELDYREVSDDQYLEDIENTLATASVSHLERRLDLTYGAPSWRFLGRIQDFQPLIPGTEPYQLRPQLLAAGAGNVTGLRYDFRTEYAQFIHSTRDPTGARIDIYPALSAPLEGDYWFVTPRVALRHTQYLIDDTDNIREPSRTLSLSSLDTGLFFERELAVADESLINTVEPRLYYLYVPFEDQSDLPVFDTTPMSFSFAQLFRENRYTGADRVGDAHQLTAAVTTRFLSGSSGRELVRASVGQTYYFDDRQVSLPDEQLPERDYSDVAGELAATPLPSLEISAATRWDPDVSDAQETAARVRYSPDRLHVLDAAYRVRENGNVMNRDMLVLWPLTRNWHAVGRWYYDLVAERTLESVVGIEYESCCWTVRVVGRDRPVITADGGLESDRSIYFTLELKGLASIGQSLESVIEEGLVGYR